MIPSDLFRSECCLDKADAIVVPPSVLEHNCGSSALPIKWWSARDGASTSVAMAKVENKSGKMRPLKRNSFLLSRAASPLLVAENNIQLAHTNNQADIRLPRQTVSFYVTNHPHSCEDGKFLEGGRREKTLADWNELFKKPLFGLLPFRSGHVLTLKFYQGFSSNDVLFSASTRASTANFSASPPPKILRTHDDFIIDVIWCDVRGK